MAMTSDLDNAISSINDAATQANLTTDFFVSVLDGDKNSSITNPVSGKSCPSLRKQIDDRFTSDSSKLNALVSQATSQADRAEREADRAAQITGLDTVSDAVALASLPTPDVWAPLSDSLRMITGYGRDVLVGSDVVARMVNFSRNSTATYIGKDGLLKTAAANEPRFEKEGLLIEGQSQNIFIASDAIAAPSAASVSTSVVTDEGIAAFTSVINKTKVVRAIQTVNAPGNTITLQSSMFVAGKTYTASVWCRTDAGASIQFRLQPNGFSPPPIIVTGDKWVRRSVTFTIPADYSSAGGLLFSINQGEYLGIPLYFTGLQVEELPFASSYIPTEGAAVTRAADQVWLPAAGNRFIGGLYAASFEFDLLGRVAGAGFSRLLDFDNSGGADRQHISLTEGGQLQCVMGPSQTTASVTGKLAGRAAMRMNNFALNVMMDGVAGSSVTASGVGSSANNRIVLMNSNVFNLPSYGHIRNLRMWSKHPISNDQLRTAA